MSLNYIADNQTTYGAIAGNVFPKADQIPLDPSTPPNRGVVANDWNILAQAEQDTRDWIRGTPASAGANWFGFAEGVNPAPAGHGGVGQPGYIYARASDHTWHGVLNGVDTTFGSGGGGGSLQDAYNVGPSGNIILANDAPLFDIDLNNTGGDFRVEDTTAGIFCLDVSVGFGLQTTTGQADGASAVGAYFNTSHAWSNTAARLAQFNNNSVETFGLLATGAMIFSADASSAVSSAGTGRIIYNNSTHTFQASVNGGGYADLGAGLSGGTTNALPIWTSSSAIGNSALFKDATDLYGFHRTTNPLTLRVYGTFTDTSNYEAVELGFDSTRYYLMHTAAGTGTIRGLNIGTGGTTTIRVDGSHNFYVLQNHAYFGSGADIDLNAASATQFKIFVNGTADQVVEFSRTANNNDVSLILFSRDSGTWTAHRVVRDPGTGALSMP